jgi:hypothetical protein
MDHFFTLRRAYHRACSHGRWYDAWAILGELGETEQYGSWLDMRDAYVRELAWDG